MFFDTVAASRGIRISSPFLKNFIDLILAGLRLFDKYPVM